MNDILNRLKNPSTIIAIVGAAIIIANQLGLGIDSEKIMYITNSLCGIGIAVGVLNNPTTKGIDNLIDNKKGDI